VIDYFENPQSRNLWNNQTLFQSQTRKDDELRYKMRIKDYVFECRGVFKPCKNGYIFYEEAVCEEKTSWFVIVKLEK